jgi:hypothetical protein
MGERASPHHGAVHLAVCITWSCTPSPRLAEQVMTELLYRPVLDVVKRSYYSLFVAEVQHHGERVHRTATRRLV